MTYRITGLDPAAFAPLYGLSEAELAERGVQRIAVEANPGAPCRVTLGDAPVGASVLLLNYEHQPHETPYRSRHAIFVTEGAETVFDAVGVLPSALRLRPLSIRAFDAGHIMLDADLADGAAAVEATILRMLAAPETAYLQAHYARRGCYAAKVKRA